MESASVLLLANESQGPQFQHVESKLAQWAAGYELVRWLVSSPEHALADLPQALEHHDPLLVVVVAEPARLWRPVVEQLSATDLVALVLMAAPPASLRALEQKGRFELLDPQADTLPDRIQALIGGQIGVGDFGKSQALRQIVGRSPCFLKELRKLPNLATCDARVFIRGETGTGKEVFARAIHYLSARAAKPFVAVNCGALPVDLMENELFGHERGAYTGAQSGHQGMVREAEGGTLFLDEIGCLPLVAQAKLLRLVQEREYRPLGSRRTLHADVRIISATHEDLAQAVVEGRFRQDLYYRLNIIEVKLPPLRERNQDLELLAEHFLAKYSSEYGRGELVLTEAARARLYRHDWPGNVRELEHVIERAVVMCRGKAISERQVRFSDLSEPEAPESFGEAKHRAVNTFEVNYLQSMLRISRGNISRAAKLAKKNRRAFFELLRKHHIDVDHFRPHPAG